MTHTLHRRGTYENLKNDYVIFAIAAQTVNAKGTAPLFQDFYNIVNKYDPVNIGDMVTGNMYSLSKSVIENGTKDNSIFHAVFTDVETVVKVLKDLKEANLGLSIVVSGILKHVDKCCSEAGIQRHTVENSLGILGNTKKLPTEKVLQINTMCGHGMIAFNLIEYMAEMIKMGKKTAKEAAEELASQCHCGIVNPVRVAAILEEMAKLSVTERD
ncbi:hypothetical protein K8M07_02580 [Schnuerera sp. xch1]|uniref:hypothetical protein n=1 Tax=Schnuerera sp. xch1 TaxID=2874283 RepID=UPI001CC1922E|nr:hypothetical protein [Schnuerera sp. xch1]MBZ2174126.1 hypothetical protein [Schnuerera sp. xch1]